MSGMMPEKSLLEQRIQSRKIPIFHVMRSCQQSALHYETRVFITVYAVGNKLVENMPVTGIYWFRHFYGEYIFLLEQAGNFKTIRRSKTRP